MVGKYHIEIYSSKLKYEFDITRNLTVIRGDSATGKTQLIRMLSDYSELGADSGITLICERECVVLTGRRWKETLTMIHDSIVFIDEGHEFVKQQAFADAVHGSSNYFVLITREKLSMLPYSIREIYGIREHGRYPAFTPVYNELYPLYSESHASICRYPDILITEDGKSGYQFFHHAVSDQNVSCVSANGKSNVLGQMISFLKNDCKILAIVDGAAFGPEMEEIAEFIQFHKNFHLYAPESFEWVILKSGIVLVEEDKLEYTYDYADSTKFMSWEQYYTDLLKELTQDTLLHYSKERLKGQYLSEQNTKKILAVMKEIKI